MNRIAVHTLGCKVNQYDSEAMLELFEQAGYTPVPFEAEAEVYLVNTCTVTGTGDQKSLKLIRKLGREHPNSDIIVAGCLAQREPEKYKNLQVRLCGWNVYFTDLEKEAQDNLINSMTNV